MITIGDLIDDIANRMDPSMVVYLVQEHGYGVQLYGVPAENPDEDGENEQTDPDDLLKYYVGFNESGSVVAFSLSYETSKMQCQAYIDMCNQQRLQQQQFDFDQLDDDDDFDVTPGSNRSNMLN